MFKPLMYILKFGTGIFSTAAVRVSSFLRWKGTAGGATAEPSYRGLRPTKYEIAGSSLCISPATRRFSESVLEEIRTVWVRLPG